MSSLEIIAVVPSSNLCPYNTELLHRIQIQTKIYLPLLFLASGYIRFGSSHSNKSNQMFTIRDFLHQIIFLWLHYTLYIQSLSVIALAWVNKKIFALKTVSLLSAPRHKEIQSKSYYWWSVIWSMITVLIITVPSLLPK